MWDLFRRIAGDATSQVIQDIYAGIVDEDRMYNAELMYFSKRKHKPFQSVYTIWFC